MVIGVHRPEFAFERNTANVKKAVADLHIGYPVAVDNDYAIWRAFGNQYWPAHYFIDAEGRIRHHHFGEGDYEESERVIQQLLAEPRQDQRVVRWWSQERLRRRSCLRHRRHATAGDLSRLQPGGKLHLPRRFRPRTPRNVIHPARLSSTNGGLSRRLDRSAPRMPRLNSKDGTITYRFHARDLHLVLGPAPEAGPIRFRVTIDSAAPGANHGSDTDADGQGVVDISRLY